MASITKVTITIQQPVEKVWALLMDPENLKHWLTGFVSLEQLSGKADEPGSTSKMTFKENGKLVEVIETITVSKPNQQFAFNMKHKSFENETDIRLIPFGNRTEMMQTVQFSPKGTLMKIMTPLLKGVMKKRMTNELLAFKKFAESKSLILLLMMLKILSGVYN